MVMAQLAADLRDEGDELHALLSTLSDADWQRPTPFKDWTPDYVMQHLFMGDWMNTLSLTDPARFDAVMAIRQADRAKGLKTMGLEHFDDGEAGQGTVLLAHWHQRLHALCDIFAAADPKARMKWVGPDMSVRSAATARLMETWAHGQDIYDLLHRARVPTDRIRNIATLGVNTYGWTFQVHGQKPPGPAPHVRLSAPSGAVWTWNEPDEANMIEGPAVDFCHVVTQGRNINEVNLMVTGATAQQWMAIAQCFAGAPETPPEVGRRGW
jgi:uncharacterized protein (TIGR03084 family)